ncbi:hypothetical protein ILUMI_10610, partial [Ignelater luminosus]
MNNNQITQALVLTDAFINELLFNNDDDEDILEKVWDYAEETVPQTVLYDPLMGLIYLPITAPKESPQPYVNLKDFIQSFFKQYVIMKYSLLIVMQVKQDRCGNNLHLVGDAAYKVTRTMMVPYKAHGVLTPIELNYNEVHSKTRLVIEQTFALLK